MGSDPEGSAILFMLDSGPEGAALSAAGLLVWKVMSQTAEKFVFSISDDCNAKTTETVEVRYNVLSLTFAYYRLQQGSPNFGLL